MTLTQYGFNPSTSTPGQANVHQEAAIYLLLLIQTLSAIVSSGTFLLQPSSFRFRPAAALPGSLPPFLGAPQGKPLLRFCVEGSCDSSQDSAPAHCGSTGGFLCSATLLYTSLLKLVLLCSSYFFSNFRMAHLPLATLGGIKVPVWSFHCHSPAFHCIVLTWQRKSVLLSVDKAPK